MNGKNITAAGIELLFRIIKSCPVEMSNGGQEIRDWLQTKALRRKSESFLELLELAKSASGNKCTDNVFEDIADYAKMQRNDINEILLFRYFAGPHHQDRIYKSLLEKCEEGMSHEYAAKMLIFHMLIPVELMAVDGDRVCAIYRNDFGNEDEFVSEVPLYDLGLFSFDCEKKPLMGDEWYTHYGMLVRPVKSEAEKDLVIHYNSEAPKFVHACKKVGIGGISVKNMHFAKHVKMLCEK